MRIRFFGGLEVRTDTGLARVRGRGQEALLFRLAVDAGTTIPYRVLAEDIWPLSAPEDPRAALQSLASRLRRELPAGALVTEHGGYRLAVARSEVDIAHFHDLARRARQADSDAARDTARQALDLWRGEPWTPGEGFEWAAEELLRDAEFLRSVVPAVTASRTVRNERVIGRDHERRLIDAQCTEHRLVTLIGPGGAGKTTLALDAVGAAPHAITASLAPVAPGDVWSALAGSVSRSLRLSDGASAMALPPRERVLDALAARPVVLFVDNCEHVVEEVAAAIDDLLQNLPALRVLATSREPLGISGEAFVTVGPLAPEAARELFDLRVHAARAAALTSEEQPVAQRIVERLDGLPLAVELAAAKTRTLSLEELEQGITRRFDVLTGGPRTAHQRHRTLRGLVDWSWDLLREDEQTAWVVFAALPDGVGLTDAAPLLHAHRLPAAVLDELVDRSLAFRHNGRYRMLETLREYAADAVAVRPDAERRATITARFFADRALAEDERLRGPDMRDALSWFDANEENLTAALRAQQHETTGLDLVRAHLWVWILRERFDELMSAVSRYGDQALDSESAVVVRGVGLVAFLMTATPQAEGTLAPSTIEVEQLSAAAAEYPTSEIAQAIPLLLRTLSEAWHTHVEGAPWSHGITFPTGQELQSLPPWSEGLIAVMTAAAAHNGANLEEQARASARAVACFREVGDAWGVSFASVMYAEWLAIHGRADEALEVLAAAQHSLTGLISAADVVQQNALAVYLLAHKGRFDEAWERAERSRAAAHTDGSERAIVHAELTAALLEVCQRDGAAALRRLAPFAVPSPTLPQPLIAALDAVRSDASVLSGDLESARQALLRAIPAAIACADAPIIADAARSVAIWLVASQRTSEAARALALNIRLRGALDLSDPVLVRLHAELGDVPTDDPHARAEELLAFVA